VLNATAYRYLTERVSRRDRRTASVPAAPEPDDTPDTRLDVAKLNLAVTVAMHVLGNASPAGIVPLSAAEVAHRAGIRPSDLTNLRRYGQQPPRRVYHALLAWLHISAALLERDDPEDPPARAVA
jgi:hypothetical protein